MITWQHLLLDAQKGVVSDQVNICDGDLSRGRICSKEPMIVSTAPMLMDCSFSIRVLRA